MKKLLLAATAALAFSSAACAAPRRAAGRVTLLFAGDLMAHEAQLDAARRGKGYDFKPSFAAVKDIVGACDIAVANFETTLGGGRGGYTGYPRFSAPDEFAAAVKDAGFDVLTTANNHCMDRGFAGLKRTVEKLRELGFDTCGTYPAPDGRDRPLVREAKGVKVAFLSWTYGTNGIPVAPDKQWSVARLDSARAVSGDFARARALAPDFVVALPHIGAEYVPSPPRAVVAFVEKALALGADAVIASHPHVVQPFELRAPEGGPRAFIAWSMGNFVSGQRAEPRDMGALARLTIEKSGGVARVVSADVIPTWVQMRTRRGKRVFRVLPLSRALGDPARYSISDADLRRIERAHADFTKRILGRSVPAARARLAYEIFPAARELFSTAAFNARERARRAAKKRAKRPGEPAERATENIHKEDSRT